MAECTCKLCGQPVPRESPAATWSTETWPTGLEQIAEIIGPELTMKLTERFGGTHKFTVPKNPECGSKRYPWADVIGKDAWVKLCAALGGQKVSLPRGQFISLKKRQIIELAESTDLGARQIALRCHATEQYVRMVLSEVRDDRQQTLF